jgi:TatD DNase family protein
MVEGQGPIALMIDSHCHLADTAFAGDLSEVIERARAVGVQRAMCILAAGDQEESKAATSVRRLWPGVRVAVGVHPHQANTFAGRAEEAAAAVSAAVKTEGASAVGEIGLDYHYDFSPPAVQQAVFSAQVSMARELGVPVVIHTREASDDTFEILRRAGQSLVRGVFHCFTGDVAMARTALDLGFHISIAGIVTFPRSDDIRKVAAFVPPERLLIETDSPYLSPAPHRGKRNEPAFVVRVLEDVAALRGITREALGEQLVHNFDALLGPTVSQIKA